MACCLIKHREQFALFIQSRRICIEGIKIICINGNEDGLHLPVKNS